MDKHTVRWWIERAGRLECEFNEVSSALQDYMKGLNHAMTALITAGWMIDKDYPIAEVLEVIDDAIIEYRGFMEQKFPIEDEL